MDPTQLAVAGHRDGLFKLRRLLDRGWVESHDGFVAGVLELPIPPFNAVTLYAEADRTAVTDALQHVRAAGLPFSLNSRPEAAELAAAIAGEFGMVGQPGMPLMGVTQAPAEPTLDGLVLRAMTGEESETHARIAAEAFGGPIMLELAAPDMMTGQDVHFVAADLHGETVATAIADVNGDAAWIYSVATLPSHRRRGLGAAVSAAATRTAFAAGATGVFLLSSPMGAGVYESLGFAELEWWSTWVGEPPA
jgi:GNAT superfamily N-acetyltransferase